MNYKNEPQKFEISQFKDESNIMSEQYMKIVDVLLKMVTSSDIENIHEKENLVLIDGGRGSGKTTALLSLFNYVEKGDEFKTVYPLGNIIDPSMFNSNSSLLQLVVSAMFNDIRPELKHYSDDSNYLLAKFEDVTRILNYDSNYLKDAADYAAELNTNSNYFNLKNKISELVKCFLKLKSKEDIKYTDICIFIDDIDLNIDYSYNMIEQIRKYLKQSNILIVIASMGKNIKYTFSKTLVPQYGPLLDISNKYETEKKSFETNFVINEVDNYILKLMPKNNRIILPNTLELWLKLEPDAGRILLSKFDLVENSSENFSLTNPMIEMCALKWVGKIELREYIQDYFVLNDNDGVVVEKNIVCIPTILYNFIEDYFFEFDNIYKSYNNGKIIIEAEDVKVRLSNILENFDNSKANESQYIELYFYMSWLRKSNNNVDLFKSDNIFKDIDIFDRINFSNLIFLFSCMGSKYYLTDWYDLKDCADVDILSLAYTITKTKKKKGNKSTFLNGIKNVDFAKAENYDKTHEIFVKNDMKDIRFENLDDELRLLDFEISKAMDSNSYDTINKLNTKIRKTKFKDIINEEALIVINNDLKKYRKTTTDEKPDYKRYNNKYSKLLKRLLNL